MDADITKLQPPFDETDQKQGTGGWPILLKYLASARFRDDVLNTEFIVLQIDSDIAGKLGVAHKDLSGNELSSEIVISGVRTQLILDVQVFKLRKTAGKRVS